MVIHFGRRVRGREVAAARKTLIFAAKKEKRKRDCNSNDAGEGKAETLSGGLRILPR